MNPLFSGGELFKGSTLLPRSLHGVALTVFFLTRVHRDKSSFDFIRETKSVWFQLKVGGETQTGLWKFNNNNKCLA